MINLILKEDIKKILKVLSVFWKVNPKK